MEGIQEVIGYSNVSDKGVSLGKLIKVIETEQNVEKVHINGSSTQQTKDENVDDEYGNDEPETSEELSEKDKIFNKKLEGFYEEYYLSSFQKFAVGKFLRENVGKSCVSRIRDWIINKMNEIKRPNNCPEMQRGCPEVIPGLRAYPFWDSNNLPWISDVQSQFEEIKAELLALRNEKGFQPYRGPSWTSDIKAKDGIGRKSNDSGDWNVFYMFLHNIRFEENCKKVPKTIAMIEKIFPRHYHHAFFSAVTPGTHIMKHHGPTNKKLRFHMPILGVNNSRLRAGDITIEQKSGQCYVFDDSFEHEAWHDGEETRIVLIVDIWHPDLSTEEVKFLNLIQNAKMRVEKIISQKDEAEDNFYKIIELSKDILESNDWWSSNIQNTKEEFSLKGVLKNTVPTLSI